MMTKEQAYKKNLELQQQQVKIFQEKRQAVVDLLQAHATDLEAALGGIMPVAKYIRIAITAICRNAELLDATKVSLLSSIFASVQLGLLPDETLGEAALIGHKVGNVLECQLQPMYRGLSKLSFQSGYIADLKMGSVFSANQKNGDSLKWIEGLVPIFEHTRIGLSDPNLITHSYGIVRYTTGGSSLVCMFRQEVEDHRDRYSASYRQAFAEGRHLKHSWTVDFRRMGEKTALIQALTLAPKSPQLEKALYLARTADNERQNLSADALDVFKGDILQDATADLIQSGKDKKDQANNDAKEVSAARANKAGAAAAAALDKKK